MNWKATFTGAVIGFFGASLVPTVVWVFVVMAALIFIEYLERYKEIN
jgi:hypothetical protein